MIIWTHFKTQDKFYNSPWKPLVSWLEFKKNETKTYAN